MNWFYDTSIWITLPLFVGGFVLLSCLAVVWLRPVVRRLVDSPSEWDRALAHVIGTFGVFFGILLALVALSVYENFAETRTATLREAAQLTALYRGTTALPEEIGEPDPRHPRRIRACRRRRDFAAQKRGLLPEESAVLWTKPST